MAALVVDALICLYQRDCEPIMKLDSQVCRTHSGKTPAKNAHLNGTGLRFETMEHGGEYPDAMPQAIRMIDRRPLLYLCAAHARRQDSL